MQPYTRKTIPYNTLTDSFLLQENGFYLLQEDDSKIILYDGSSYSRKTSVYTRINSPYNKKTNPYD